MTTWTQAEAFTSKPLAGRTESSVSAGIFGSTTIVAQYEPRVPVEPATITRPGDAALDELVARCLAQLREVMDGLQ